MILGSTIIHDGTGTTAYYTPDFPRGGLAAYFTVDVTHSNPPATLVVKVEHKNEDETTWATAGTFSNITSTGVKTLDVTSLKEQIRLAFTFSAGAAGRYYHVIVAPPAWRPY